MNCILCIDGYNFLHRARSGFNLGEYPVVFNFFRNLRALVEKHNPSRVIFVLEGHPKARHELFPEYKANRRLDPDSNDPDVIKKRTELEAFFRQANLIIDTISGYFPISVVRHPDHECDDVIYNLVRQGSTSVPWIIVSNDSDFTQLLCEFEHVSVYNPITKKFFEKPSYDYVEWKALRGDASDNIPGLPGIGDITADNLVSNRTELHEFLSDDEARKMFERNVSLIKFHVWSDDDAVKMTCSSPKNDWAEVASRFEAWSFKSLLKAETWQKYTSTFDALWS